MTGTVGTLSESDKIVAKFYFAHGPCCAGCDWWEHDNALCGQCLRTAPAPGAERIAMLGFTSCSMRIGAGHIFTKRDHHCGEFKDTSDWSSLGELTRKAIGAP